jgi:hypothetical protein
MEPTYEQLQTLIDALLGVGETMGWLERFYLLFDAIRLTILFTGGGIIGSLWWRNFILAKNQRDFI